MADLKPVDPRVVARLASIVTELQQRHPDEVQEVVGVAGGFRLHSLSPEVPQAKRFSREDYAVSVVIERVMSSYSYRPISTGNFQIVVSAQYHVEWRARRYQVKVDSTFNEAGLRDAILDALSEALASYSAQIANETARCANEARQAQLREQARAVFGPLAFTYERPLAGAVVDSERYQPEGLDARVEINREATGFDLRLAVPDVETLARILSIARGEK